MPIDYEKIALVIKRRTHCTYNEAWDGLSRAFLSLDSSRTEAEQASYLLTNGANAVWYGLRYKYNADGQLRFVPIDETYKAAPETGYDFLEKFPAGVVREFATRLAEGESQFTTGSASHWLRKFKNINKRTAVKGLMDSTREAALRLLLETSL